MRNKKLKLFGVIAGVAVIAVFGIKMVVQKKTPGEITEEIKPTIGSIKTEISTTGTVLPKNRLEVKPPVNGRIEQILVKEGNKVKTGDILAWMSSTDRAALLDAARGKGEKVLAYWQDTYKPIPLPAPIDAEVIVATMQPGQTVTTSDAVIVLSDHLIVRAQVDETDIGKIKLDQEATITLDAFPDAKIKASVEHIYYESQTVNNVTIYQVDLNPETIPLFFRSGMNATIDFIESSKENALLVPVGAVQENKNEKYVLTRQENSKEPVKVRITTGISDDKNVEVLSGITASDTVLMKVKKYNLPTSNSGKNPFLPSRRR